MKPVTVLAKLVAKVNDLYTTYVFECLDEDVRKYTKYIMCTRFPNWEHRDIQIGEIGFLNYREVTAGIDKWFDGKEFVNYRYDGIHFLKFVEKPTVQEHKFVILINFKNILYEEYIMTVMKDKLIKAVADKKNDINLFVWKFPKKADKTQEEIKLVEATPEQLISFYKHCQSMLYSDDKVNPGRYTLLNLINEQRRKCNVELYLRQLEDGSLCRDGQPYPRYLYFQDIRSFIDQNKEKFEGEDWKSLSISAVTGDMPREYKRISINEVMDGCLDQLGVLSTKHITFSFILNLGICLTNAELKEFDEKDKDGKTRSKLEVIKERLGLKDSIRLMVKDGGLTYKEFRAMINLKTKVKYSELTPDQLVTLRNKVLFRLEKEVQYHISQWEDRIRQIKLVCKAKNIELPEMSLNK